MKKILLFSIFQFLAIYIYAWPGGYVFSSTEGVGLGGSPWLNDNAANYWRQSTMAHAHRIRTPTLILSTTGDERVPVSQSYKLYHALKDNEVEVRFIAYPVSGHFPGDPVHQRDVFRRWIDWIEEHSNRRVTHEKDLLRLFNTNRGNNDLPNPVSLVGHSGDWPCPFDLHFQAGTKPIALQPQSEFHHGRASRVRLRYRRSEVVTKVWQKKNDEWKIVHFSFFGAFDFG